MPDDAEYNIQRRLADRETWLVFLETVVCKNSIGANTLARLLFSVKEAIERSPDDLARAINILSDGIALTYLYTDEHRLALKLYMLYLTGHLKPQDEPLTLLRGAIERGIDKIEQARRKEITVIDGHAGKKRTLKKKQ